MPIKHEWNGTILTITSDSGTSSADLKGEKGDDGVRGAQGIPGSSIATDAISLGGIAAADYTLKSDLAAYATKDFVYDNVPSLDGYATEAYVNAAIPTYDGYASIDYVNDRLAQNGYAKNHLDNSYFPSAYVINQRGKTSYTGSGYTIDRWRIYSEATVAITKDGIEVDATSVQTNFQQNMEYIPNGIYTLAAKVNGNIVYRVIENNNGTITTINNGKAAFTGGYLMYGKSSTYYAQIVNSVGYKNTIEWIALYEGEYTADTLPPYVYKGYAAELAECQRYFFSTQGSYYNCGYGAAATTTELYATIHVPIKMRTTPTITNKGLFYARGNGKESEVIFNQLTGSHANAIYASFTGTGLIQYETYMLRTTGIVELSADL